MQQLPPGAGRYRYDKSWYLDKIVSVARGSIRMLHDGKWQSMPFFIWIGLYVFTQWHRSVADPNDLLFHIMIMYGIEALACLAYAFFGDGDKIMDLWACIICLGLVWMGTATYYGITIPQTFTGLAFTAMVSIPYWRYLREDRPRKVEFINAPTPAVPPSPADPFEDVPWLKGAKLLPGRKTTNTGYIQDLQIPNGANPNKFIAERRGGMANVLSVDVDDVDMETVKGDAKRVRLIVTDRIDVLEESVLSPLADPTKHISIWDDIPLGLNKRALAENINLRNKHLLIAGESGSGKSNLTQILMSIGVYDPICDVYGLDGKRTELYPWRDSLAGYVQDNMNDATDMMRVIVKDMEYKYDQMNDLPGLVRDAINSGGLIGPTFVMIEEIAKYLREGAGTPTTQKEFRTLLADLLERGRAAGFIISANTQRPSAKLFDGGDLRAGFTYKLAMRMADSRGSAMVLGNGADVDASKLDQGLPGLAYLLERGYPRKIRTFHVPDSRLEELIRNAPRADPEYDRRWVSPAPERKALSSVPSNVLELSQDWKGKLFSAIPADSYVSVSQLEKVVGKTRNPVIIELRRLTEAGLLEPTIDNGVTKWRKKVSVNA